MTDSDEIAKLKREVARLRDVLIDAEEVLALHSPDVPETYEAARKIRAVLRAADPETP